MIETLPTTSPTETVTPIKPSEAIRLGCLTTAPSQGDLFDRHGGACALGAALIGWFGEEARSLFAEGPIGYGEATRRMGREFVACPVGTSRWQTPCGTDTPSSMTWHLNDHHDWSRERIADWLEGLGL